MAKRDGKTQRETPIKQQRRREHERRTKSRRDVTERQTKPRAAADGTKEHTKNANRNKEVLAGREERGREGREGEEGRGGRGKGRRAKRRGEGGERRARGGARKGEETTTQAHTHSGVTLAPPPCLSAQPLSLN